MPYDYDLLVVGGGAAGLTAAGYAALLGARTGLIESRRLGGDCTWTGCVPSKTLLRAARLAHDLRHPDRFGLASPARPIDTGGVFAHVRAVQQQIYEEADAPPQMERYGLKVLPGQARFLDPHTVELAHDGRLTRLTARRFVIATGARPRPPAFPALTTETLWDLHDVPRRCVIAGGGPISVELAQAFARLGSMVTLVAKGPRLLERDDAELTVLVQQRLQEEGVRLSLQTTVERHENGQAYLSNGASIACDAVLAAFGRQPHLEGLGLDAAGVTHSPQGIITDDRCRTTQRHIAAVGDAAGRWQFTHMAEHAAKVAVNNLILGLPTRLDTRHVTWCTFTDPELAHVGTTGDDPRGQTFRREFARVDRAITEGDTLGLVKVRTDRRGRILGVSILSEGAGELIAEWALAMKHGLTLDQVSATIHPYPTRALASRQLADQRPARLLGHPLLRLWMKLRGYRGVPGEYRG